MVTRVKICGLRRPQDAELALDLGADALGFVLEPTSPRCISRRDVPWIAALGPLALRVAVFGAKMEWSEPSAFHLVQGLGTIEGDDPSCFLEVLRLREGDTARGVLSRPIRGAAIVLDAHVEGAFGGTGRRVDWGLAAEVVALADRRVVLAGGLTPDNVVEAIRTVRPYAVDASSGLESAPGVKDAARMRAFVQAAKGSS